MLQFLPYITFQNLQQYIYSNRLTYTFPDKISFGENTVVTVKINNQTQFKYTTPSAANQLSSLTFSEQRINDTGEYTLNLLSFSKQVGHQNQSNVSLVIEQQDQAQQEYNVTYTQNQIYYAIIPQMKITLTGDSETQKYNLVLQFTQCSDYDLSSTTSSSFLFNLNGYQFKLGSNYNSQDFQNLKNNGVSFSYNFSCSDIDYTVSECYTIMKNIQKQLNDGTYNFTIQRTNIYTVLQVAGVDFNDSNVTYPDLTVTLDTNSIIVICVVILAIILIIALVIYCCYDYRSSALKEVPVVLGQNQGFGSPTQASANITEAKKIRNQSYNYNMGFGYKQDIQRYKEIRELKKSMKESQIQRQDKIQ